MSPNEKKSESNVKRNKSFSFLGILNVWCYVLVQRDSHGLWTFMTYSMLPKDSLDQIRAKITIGNTTDTRKFTFETKILSFETSKDEAVKMGQYMCLQDSQIKPFKQGNLLRGIVNWSGVARSVVQGPKQFL